ncbi:MAG: hypothetical protein K2Q32_02225 [Alphaproteobacteria bacterium]|nr:hypothetical protein [Alphaproteobacteria bacterium]
MHPMADTKPRHTANLHGFQEIYGPQLLAVMAQLPDPSSPNSSYNLAYAKGALIRVWEEGYETVQSARKKYFALSALALTADIYFLGGSVTAARAVLTTAEVTAMAVAGTKLFRSWRRDNSQFHNADTFKPDPQAPADRPVFQASKRRLHDRYLERGQPQPRPNP